ncbi:MAG: TlyA family RNA methyltransferase [Bacillota bacterium]|nr:TlyA family RNA methyltransferase [Bacillota bacterium]
MDKERLDVILYKRGFFPSREKAQGAVMAGCVLVDGERADKPGVKFNQDINISIKENPLPFVSRGGLKLQKAIDSFGLNLQGKKCIDIGASTGGFTDCMLQRGAEKVYAVDVGYGQLAWNLRNDSRVVCMERTNIRYVKPEQIGEILNFASIDVSFISLKKVLPVAKELTGENGEIVSLIKPQFEAGREKVGKHGVVREPETHIEVITSVLNFSVELGLKVKGLAYSPIKGPEGNIEYLAYLAKSGESIDNIEKIISETVSNAHEGLK